jgi:hypothetical protein
LQRSHIAPWSDGGKRNFCFTLALTFYPLPSAFAFRSGAIASKHSEDGQERKWLLADSGFAGDCPANSVARIFKETENDSPSPWGSVNSNCECVGGAGGERGPARRDELRGEELVGRSLLRRPDIWAARQRSPTII